MFGRGWFGLFLVAAAGLPYVLSSSSNVGDLLRRIGPEAADPTASAAPQPGAAAALAAATRPGGPPVQAAAVKDLGELFRWDATSAWILGRWPRVSTGLSELDFQGYRLPLVTGTRPDDLAGSLTYYFDNRQQVQKITFTGSTGDTRRLVALLVGRHAFQRAVSRDPGLHLYEVRHRGKVISQLRIKPAGIVRADVPHSRFELDLVMTRR